MATMNTGSHPKALWPGVHAWVMGTYDKHPEEFSQIFDVESSKMAYEEDVETYGFGLAQIKTEGGAIAYDSNQQGFTKRYTHVAYGLGWIITREAIDDNLYPKLSRQHSQNLVFSFRTTKEMVHANILNRAFTAGYNGGDGKELIATDHPTLNGTQSNELAVAADLSEASLEDALTLIETMTNTRGHPIAIRGQKLIVAPGNHFNATRILKSSLQSGAANNDVNAIKSMGMLPGGAIVNHYLTDSDAWFVKTDAPNGLISFQRTAFEFGKDNDFDTKNAKAAGYERYSCGWTEWRSIVGTPGA